jgi:hypothetical protein
MGEPARKLEEIGDEALSPEMIAFADHLAGARPPERMVTDPSGRVEIALRGSVLAR